jgi:hypothetical protein
MDVGWDIALPVITNNDSGHVRVRNRKLSPLPLADMSKDKLTKTCVHLLIQTNCEPVAFLTITGPKTAATFKEDGENDENRKRPSVWGVINTPSTAMSPATVMPLLLPPNPRGRAHTAQAPARRVVGRG